MGEEDAPLGQFPEMGRRLGRDQVGAHAVENHHADLPRSPETRRPRRTAAQPASARVRIARGLRIKSPAGSAGRRDFRLHRRQVLLESRIAEQRLGDGLAQHPAGVAMSWGVWTPTSTRVQADEAAPFP